MIIRIFTALLLVNFSINGYPTTKEHEKHFNISQNTNLTLKNKPLAWAYEEQKECTICLNEINKKNVKLPCNHKFHKNCIFDWFKKKIECPTCRNDFKSHPEFLAKMQAKVKPKKTTCSFFNILKCFCIRNRDRVVAYDNDVHDIHNIQSFSAHTGIII